MKKSIITFLLALAVTVTGSLTGLLESQVYANSSDNKIARPAFGMRVAKTAKQGLGTPYVWSGSNMYRGADCSGFVMSVYSRFGKSLPHSSSALRNVGRGVSYSSARPGDILCYRGHVAIYIGRGRMIHASSTHRRVVIGRAKYRPIIAVRRIN